jgi:biopolymer transport protein TolR
MAGGIQKRTTGGRRGRRGRRQMSDINVTPFVDVMLVLLIVFMVTAPMLTSGVQVNLPDAASSPMPGQDEPLTITVAADGKIYIQDSQVAFDELAAKLLAITKEKKDTRIFLRGDRSLDYGRMMQVFGSVSQSGFTNIALLTDPAARQAAVQSSRTTQ